MSRWLPYGWKQDPKNPKLMMRDIPEQQAIDRMMDLYEEGKSPGAIARILTDEGYKPRRHKKTFKGKTVSVKGTWHRVTIYRIIRRVLQDGR